MSGTRKNTADMPRGRPTWTAVALQLLLVVATSTVIVWVNQEVVVPRGARAHFMASMLSTSAADPVDFLAKADRLGLLLMPLAAVVRIAFVALVDRFYPNVLPTERLNWVSLTAAGMVVAGSMVTSLMGQGTVRVRS